MKGSKGSCLMAPLVMVHSTLLTPEHTRNASGATPQDLWLVICLGLHPQGMTGMGMLAHSSQQRLHCMFLDRAPGRPHPCS